jgi:hypothetical protein
MRHGAINSHFSPISSLCRFVMTEAQQLTRLTRKRPIWGRTYLRRMLD